MSSSSLLVAACAVIYTACTYFLWRNASSKIQDQDSWSIVLGFVALAIILHGYILYLSVFTQNGPNISLSLAVSMAGWISVTLYFCISCIRKTVNLGIIVLPMGLIAVITGAITTGNAISIDQIPEGMGWHIAIAVPTYGILCVAFAQACLLIVQDRLLHKPNPGKNLPALPAMQTMDSTLLWLTLVGFLLMTINLVIGVTSNIKFSGRFIEFNHHNLLSILAWVGFGSLLLGRRIAGWRGEIAAKWTIIAFGILILAYFGTRFVNDLILRN